MSSPYHPEPEPVTYIYGLVDPRTDRLRYIGKANKPTGRLRRHIREAAADLANGHTRHKCNWLLLLEKEGLKPRLVILEEVAQSQWKTRERYWIAYHQAAGEPLLNTLPGGEGCAPEETWKLATNKGHSDETKRKMAAAARVRWEKARAENGGVIPPVIAPEVRAKVRGCGRPKGKLMTEEGKANLRVARRHYFDNETEEQRAARKQRARKMWEGADYRTRQSESQRAAQRRRFHGPQETAP